jgi:hypothetical protein
MSSVSAREQFDARVMELIDQFFDPQTTSAVVTELQTLGIPDELVQFSQMLSSKVVFKLYLISCHSIT